MLSQTAPLSPRQKDFWPLPTSEADRPHISPWLRDSHMLPPPDVTLILRKIRWVFFAFSLPFRLNGNIQQASDILKVEHMETGMSRHWQLPTQQPSQSTFLGQISSSHELKDPFPPSRNESH